MQEPSIEEALLTTSQVAQLLHVHPNTVRKWVDRGLLAAYRLGPRGDRRFSRENLQRFLNSEWPADHS